MKRLIIMAITSGFLIFANGCSSSFAPIRPDHATLQKLTGTTQELNLLPRPKEKIVAAVYKFRDQTGQYKLTNAGTSWSTAVTQGATSILMKALEESNWFMAIEREGLSNLLNERKIIRSSRANYKGTNGEDLPPLPPLLYGGIILEGGIISYETNLITGGMGLKYFGTGGSNQYREDKVTIYLRAISTQNGRVLKTVTTSKKILSQMLDVNLFKYVEFKKILEIETGYSYNEPVDMCVTEAIEKAVYSLIVEGVIDNLWAFADTTDQSKKIIEDYEKERQAASSEDYNNSSLTFEKSFGIEVAGGLLLGSTDYPNSRYNSYKEIGINYPLLNQISLSLSLGFGKIHSEKFFNTDVYPLNLKFTYNFAPENYINPFLFGGVGLLKYYFKKDYGKQTEAEKFTSDLCLGIGTEINLHKKFSINLKFENNFPLSDELDGIKNGKWYDTFSNIKIGFCYYPNR